ncbi:MAG: hypothetical protein ACK4YP_04170 [Myxococcota bacterium]
MRGAPANGAVGELPRGRTFLGGAVLAALLAWGAVPYLPGQIDDAYIVFAYAHRIVEFGEVAWNTGVRVEGYSSPLHLALMTLGAWAGADLSVYARGVSFAAALSVLAWLLTRRFGPDRLWLAALVVAWQPFQYWSTMGLETAVATLLGALAWPLVLGDRRQWAGGTLLLALFSLTRPEGAAWLGLAILRRLTLGRERGAPEYGVGMGLVLLAAYHGLRVSYFGHLLPTPYLVKIAAIDAYVGGARQAGRELVSAGALLAGTWLFRRRLSPWVWLPVVVQAGLLIRAGGDWMGHARFLVPGVMASVAAAWWHGEARSPRAIVRAVVVAGAVFGFAWEPSHEAVVEGRGVVVSGWRNPWFLRRPMEAMRTPWAVALLEETSFLIEHVPPGAGAAISDVGLPGNLADVRIWDNAGLTDRVTAMVIASPDNALVQELRDRYDDPDDIWCMRYVWSEEGTDTADAWIQETLPVVWPSRSASPHMRWRCREGAKPAADTVLRRWAELVARYPSQDWIRWYYGRALLQQGSLRAARDIAGEALWLGDQDIGWLAFGDRQGAEFRPGRGWALYANGVRESVPLPHTVWTDTQLLLDVDDPGDEGARVTLRWSDACGETESLQVKEPVAVDPPTCTIPGTRRLQVAFQNDRAEGGSDRNLYVSLRSTAEDVTAGAE